MSFLHTRLGQNYAPELSGIMKVNLSTTVIILLGLSKYLLKY